MGFKGSDDVKPLTYDFTPYHGTGEVTIKEPSDKQIAAFYRGYSKHLRLNRDDAVAWDEKMTGAADDAARRAIEDEYAEWQEADVEAKLARRRVLLSDLCSGDPSIEALEQIPGRWLDEFESYVVEELNPKGSKSG